MDACNISQFEALVRVIFDMPIPHIKYYHKCKMINILGENYNVIEKSLYNKNQKIYVYGKDQIKEGRKLGHINILS
jgi:phosphoribosylaminoimidazole carboxylase (NCAIR synthetase)